MLILKFGATLPPDFDLNNIDQSLLQPADVNDDTAVELKDYSDFLDNSSKPSSTQNQRILKFIDDRDPKNKKKIVPKSQIKPVDPNLYSNLWTSNSYNYDNNKNKYRNQKAQKLVAKIEKIDVKKLLTFDENPTASPNKKKKLKPVMPVDIDSNYVVLANADYVNTQPIDESAYIENLYQSDYVDMDSFWSQEADLGQGNWRSG